MTSNKGPIEIKLVDTDAPELYSKDDKPRDVEPGSCCALTQTGIIGPAATLDQIKKRIESAATTSPAAQIRRMRNETDPNLN